MELFLRAAYELPIHDVERERDVVRARLARDRGADGGGGEGGGGAGALRDRAGVSRARGSGAFAGAPGEGDRGGVFVGGSRVCARARVRGALSAGGRGDEADHERGGAEEEGRRSSRRSSGIRRSGICGRRWGRGSRSPAYAEGLIALYEGKNEEAIAKAREAFEKAPWMYEAKKLEGDALFAEGSKYRHDAAFDYDKMKAYFEPGGEGVRGGGGRSGAAIRRCIGRSVSFGRRWPMRRARWRNPRTAISLPPTRHAHGQCGRAAGRAARACRGRCC